MLPREAAGRGAQQSRQGQRQQKHGRQRHREGQMGDGGGGAAARGAALGQWTAVREQEEEVADRQRDGQRDLVDAIQHWHSEIGRRMNDWPSRNAFDF